ncbi:hypothetical protein GGI22_007776, partial [Coemansia erecta]
MTNCDNILTYMVEQCQWTDKLIRRTLSPNFDGAHGYIALILNTLRLAVQVDRRRYPGDFSSENSGHKPSKSGKREARSKEYKSTDVVSGQSSIEDLMDVDLQVGTDIGVAIELDTPKAGSSDDAHQDTLTDYGLITDALSEFSDDEVISSDNDLLPDLPYHNPAMRERLCEHPLYRLQRWEISLLYSPSFQTHLRRLRSQASTMVDEINEFRLCDQSRKEIISSKSGNGGKRPVPFFSPQKVKAPVLFENVELKKRQLQINVGLLLGNGTRRNPNSLSAPSGSGSYNSRKVPESGEIGQEGGCANYRIDEFGVDANSLYARMLGFTEDLVDLPAGSSIRNTVAGANKRGQNLGQSMSSEGGKNIGTDTKGGDKRT